MILELPRLSIAIDRARQRLGSKALAIVFALMALQCQDATRGEARPVASLQPLSVASPQPSGNSTAASPSEPSTNTQPTSTPSARPSAAEIPKGPVAILGVGVSDDKRARVARVMAAMKPAFNSCRQRALARISARTGTLTGRLRLVIRVAASGKVSEVDLPQFDRTNPMFDPDAAGSPIPNPDNSNLNQSFVPCLIARIRPSRFGATETPWRFTVDFQVQ